MNSNMIARVNHLAVTTHSSNVVFLADDFLTPCDFPALLDVGLEKWRKVGAMPTAAAQRHDVSCLVPRTRRVITTRVVAPSPPKPVIEDPLPLQEDLTVSAPFSRKSKDPGAIVEVATTPVAAPTPAAPADTEDNAFLPASVNGFATFSSHARNTSSSSDHGSVTGSVSDDGFAGGFSGFDDPFGGSVTTPANAPSATGSVFSGFDTSSFGGDSDPFGGFGAPAAATSDNSSSSTGFTTFSSSSNSKDAFSGFDAPVCALPDDDAFGGFGPIALSPETDDADSIKQAASVREIEVSLKVMENLFCVQKTNNTGALQVTKYEVSGQARVAATTTTTAVAIAPLPAVSLSTDIKVAVSDPKRILQKISSSSDKGSGEAHKPAESTVVMVKCDADTVGGGGAVGIASAVVSSSCITYNAALNTAPVVLARFKSFVTYKPTAPSTPPTPLSSHATATTVFCIAKLSVQVSLHTALTTASSKFQVDGLTLQVSLAPLMAANAKIEKHLTVSIGQLQLQPKENGQYNATSKVVQWIHRPKADQPLPSVLTFQALVQLCIPAQSANAFTDTPNTDANITDTETTAVATPTLTAPKPPSVASLPGIIKLSLSKSLPSQVCMEVTGASVHTIDNDDDDGGSSDGDVSTAVEAVVSRQTVEYTCKAEYKFI